MSVICVSESFPGKIMKENDLFVTEFFLEEKIYRGFINLFGDKNPLHVDKEYAVQKGFRDNVVHGNILSGFLSFFIGECLPVKNVILVSQNMKYHKPMYINDKLRLNAIITGIFESVNIIEMKFKFLNQSDEKIASGNFQIGILQ